jgi:hypothetical protein
MRSTGQIVSSCLPYFCLWPHPFFWVQIQLLHLPMLEEGAQPHAVVRDVRLLSNNDNVILPPRGIELGEFLTWPKSASRVVVFCRQTRDFRTRTHMNERATIPSPTTTILVLGTRPPSPTTIIEPLALPVPFSMSGWCKALSRVSADKCISPSARSQDETTVEPNFKMGTSAQRLTSQLPAQFLIYDLRSSSSLIPIYSMNHG